MKVDANTLRPGHAMEYNGKLWIVSKIQIIQPGKGGSFIQVEMKDARTGTKGQVKFRTAEAVDRVRLDEHEMTFLFAEGDMYTFMDKTTFEQIQIPGDAIGDAKVFLQDGMEVNVQMYEGSPLSVELPQTVTLRITQCEPFVRGQTASSSYKPAILENGVRVMVPPHIDVGTKIVINTSDSTYIERAKD